MDELRRRQVMYGAGVVLVVCMAAWLIMLFWPKAQPTQQSLVDAAKPVYDYDADSFIQENPDLFLTQLVPLVGNLETAVARGEGVEPAAELLKKELVRWQKATPPVLRPTIQRYIDATDTLSGGNKEDAPRALTTLNEIKTLALENQRNDLQSLTR